MTLFPNPRWETREQQDCPGSDSTAFSNLYCCNLVDFRDLASTLKQKRPQKRKKETIKERKNTLASFMYKLLFTKITFKSQMFSAILDLLWNDRVCLPTLQLSTAASPTWIIFIVSWCNLLSLVFITNSCFFSLFLTYLHPMGQNNVSFGVEGVLGGLSSTFMISSS